MQLITAVIVGDIDTLGLKDDETRFPEVRDALLRLGITGMTVSPVGRGGETEPVTDIFRGNEYVEREVPCLCIEVAVEDEFASPCIYAIERAARRGKHAIGLIYAKPLEQVIRISTGETGRNAL